MIYLDNHATTRVDPVVVEALVELFSVEFANPGSTSHLAGREVAQRVEESLESIAQLLGAQADQLVITSGATESNNLALLGVCCHPLQKRRKVVSVLTEHRAILDPLRRLEQLGFEVVRLPVIQHGNPLAGQIDLEQLASVVDDQTALVSIMLANNETGVLQPLPEAADICHRHGAWLHSDATQAVGRLRVDMALLQIDLLSFSAHKFYGPKGVGGLLVRSQPRPVRLHPQIVGGGQQRNRRSGTLNSPGIVAMAVALQRCQQLADEELPRLMLLRDRLWNALSAGIAGLAINGPDWQTGEARLAGNLNCAFPGVEGESLMMAVPQLAVSSGSACTSAEPEPSHVLRAMGLSVDQTRSSLRFGIGRFNTQDQIDQAAQWLIDAFHQLTRDRI